MRPGETLLKSFCVFLIALLSAPAVGCHRCAQRLPSVVLISIDTLRADHLSCYGYDRETSPHLDACARDAALFDNEYTQAPVTPSSHMPIFTFLFPAPFPVSLDISKGLQLVPDFLSLGSTLIREIAS
jgi:hypothetical protein